MIFIQPTTVEEALSAYQAESAAGRQPLWYSGGTEIITFLRKGTLKSQALIDLKGIPEYTALRKENDGWTIGAGVSLTALQEAGLPPIFKACAGPIADHTVRNRLSLGGNLCGRLPYREAVLPLLALDAQATLVSPQGRQQLPLRKQFHRHMGLEAGSFLLSVHIPAPEPELLWGSKRQMRLGPVDYPIVHVLVAGTPDHWSLYASGLCPYPISLHGLTDSQLASPENLELPVPPQEDPLASRAYRLQQFKLAVRDAMTQTGGPR